MGCASSSPLVNGGGPGGLVDNAKTAATEVMNTGENAMNGKLTRTNRSQLHGESIESFAEMSRQFCACNWCEESHRGAVIIAWRIDETCLR
jgi:hypothetical protein